MARQITERDAVQVALEDALRQAALRHHAYEDHIAETGGTPNDDWVEFYANELRKDFAGVRFPRVPDEH